MASNISSSSKILAQTTQPTFSSSLMDDTNPKSPYFLPSVDNPGIILVSQPLLGPENYSTWARAIFLSLSGRNKFGFVNGSFPMPDLSSPLLDAWNRANTSILSWLTNSLSKDIAASVMYINTTRIFGLTCEIDSHKEMLQDSLRCKRRFLGFHKGNFR